MLTITTARIGNHRPRRRHASNPSPQVNSQLGACAMTTSSFGVKRAGKKNVFCRTDTAVVGKQSFRRNCATILHNAACVIGDQGMDALAEGDVRESSQNTPSSAGR